MSIKEQAQMFVNKIMKNDICKKDFDNWVLEMDKDKIEFVVRIKRTNHKDEIYCSTPIELYRILVINANKNIIEEVINADTECDDCPYKNECD